MSCAVLEDRSSPINVGPEQNSRAPSRPLDKLAYLVVYPPLIRIVWPVIHQPSLTR